MEQEQITKIGIGVMVIKEGKVLLGKRKGSHASGEYSFPGGHLEYMESFESCAKRETLEETGLYITNVRFLNVMNIKEYAPKHFVEIGLVADWESGEPQAIEPNKIENWEWYGMDQLPSPLFSGVENYIESFRGGNNYWDA